MVINFHDWVISVELLNLQLTIFNVRLRAVKFMIKNDISYVFEASSVDIIFRSAKGELFMSEHCLLLVCLRLKR